MATRTPLIAMTAVQALCSMAKTMLDQLKTFRRTGTDNPSTGELFAWGSEDERELLAGTVAG